MEKVTLVGNNDHIETWPTDQSEYRPIPDMLEGVTQVDVVDTTKSLVEASAIY